MRQLLCTLATLTILVSAIGCNSKELTREKAKAALESAFAKGEGGSAKRKEGGNLFPLKLPPGRCDAGVKAGYWPNCNSGMPNVLTPLGSKYFNAVGIFWADEMWLRGGLNLPVHIVEISGISGDSSSSTTSKTVDYTWRYDVGSLSPEVQLIFKENVSPPYHATFKLYDDGWRVESVGEP